MHQPCSVIDAHRTPWAPYPAWSLNDLFGHRWQIPRLMIPNPEAHHLYRDIVPRMVESMYQFLCDLEYR